MSIKSWLVSRAKKREKKNIKKIVEYYKWQDIRTIRLDENHNLWYINNRGLDLRLFMLDELRRPLLKKHEKSFLKDPVSEYDRVFGVHRKHIENGKVTLVWYVQ